MAIKLESTTFKLACLRKILILGIYLLLFNGLTAQDNSQQIMMGKSVAYSKWGVLHHIDFLLLSNRLIIGYKLGVNANTTYLQRRFRPVNQLNIGVNFFDQKTLVSMYPIFSVATDTYRFQKDSRLNFLSYKAGWILKLGRGKWRFMQESSIGVGKEYHWTGEKNNYLDYQFNLGFLYEI